MSLILNYIQSQYDASNDLLSMPLVVDKDYPEIRKEFRMTLPNIVVSGSGNRKLAKEVRQRWGEIYLIELDPRRIMYSEQIEADYCNILTRLPYLDYKFTELWNWDKTQKIDLTVPMLFDCYSENPACADYYKTQGYAVYQSLEELWDSNYFLDHFLEEHYGTKPSTRRISKDDPTLDRRPFSNPLCSR